MYVEINTRAMKYIQNNIPHFHKYLFILCICSIDAKNVDLTKCCNEGQVYDVDTKSCVKWEVLNLADAEHKNPIEPALAYVDYDSSVNSHHSYTFTTAGMTKCIGGSERQLALNEISTGDDLFQIDAEHNELVTFGDGVHLEQHKHYCIERGFRNKQFLGTLAIFCHTPHHIACRRKTCLRSCCDPNMLFDLASQRCTEPDQNISKRLLYTPTIYDKKSGKPLDPRNQLDVLTLFEVPQCMKLNGPYHSYNYTDDNLIIYTTGEIKIGTQLFNQSQYCLVQIKDGINQKYPMYQANVCTPKNESNGTNQITSVQLCLLLLISYTFLS